MARCSRIKTDGERCKGTAIDSSGLCYSHSPKHAEDRHRAASKGGKRGGRGRAKPGNGDIREVKSWLLKLASDVETGKLEAKNGAVVSQILNVFLRGVEVERKIKEVEELEERLEALESVLKTRDRRAG